ncbi:PilX N-terminal domain-containing pilus assembly protein [Methyloversatilis discipulorum]|uniref:pilus assembly PilX family protein n=1 Tax=Methyloversatilis discipulorum TaxID=1119528 RepID=UPI00036E44D6|nr:PilX N-terminal domain-containing pilus assembly protein [Methyloversatilis discipulorum]
MTAHPAHAQRGVTLVVALMLLIAITLLGLASMRGTGMQERMSANLYDRAIAFQAAESALREAEALLATGTAGPFDGTVSGLYPKPAPGEDDFANRWESTATVWASASVWWDGADADTRAKAAGAPQYIIEDLGIWPSTPDCDTVTTIAADCLKPRYRITARSAPVTGRPSVLLQTTYRP